MKILAVCGMGFGSSLMLKMTADRVLKKLDVKADVEAVDIGTASSMQADLILTNNEFKKQLEGKGTDVIAVLNVASEAEMEEALKKHLNK